jgi:esterase
VVELHAAVYGADPLHPHKPHLLVLHGLFGMGDNWATLARQWSDHWVVHTLDLRNHGQSPWDAEHTYAALAADVLAYQDRTNLLAAVWLGHSMGGKVAQWGACTYPERVRALVSVDMAPKAYPPHHQEIFDALGAVDFAQCRSRNDVDAVLAARIAHPGVRQFLLKNVGRPTPDTLAWKFNLNVLIRNYVEITRALPPQFTYAGPVLFVRGGLSGYMEEQELPLLRAHFPQAQLETVPQAGHWVHAEQPEAFSRTVMNFLQTIPAPTEPGNS